MKIYFFRIKINNLKTKENNLALYNHSSHSHSYHFILTKIIFKSNHCIKLFSQIVYLIGPGKTFFDRLFCSKEAFEELLNFIQIKK
ncbi:hypothetical protein NPL7_02630 [Metamycoplasma hyosynoviae]|nr:hypothetical protein NPL7_02630 [Metamycoplasma hyosynoviae]KDE41779.1 hypothetical protein NPL3_03465 [Metamycoplasma hyosynoviae]KDE43876.1 hypothetical protein NPL5_00940 [Metamycoplasma hyosynoviae]KDE44493.1 hypothetical protein NPL6_01130 [Metamycoplasma hyosynoviae]KDE45784.1 hypothetical protein NPL4_00100 [Metamycoplasma hyosynoviae]